MQKDIISNSKNLKKGKKILAYILSNIEYGGGIHYGKTINSFSTLNICLKASKKLKSPKITALQTGMRITFHFSEKGSNSYHTTYGCFAGDKDYNKIRKYFKLRKHFFEYYIITDQNTLQKLTGLIFK